MINLPLAQSLHLLGDGLWVFDQVGQRVDGHWRATTEPKRQIHGILQPADERTQQQLPEGDRSDGVLLLHTQARLSAYDVEQSGITQRQTFLIHACGLWRLMPGQDWSVHSCQLRRYLAIRYIDHDPDHS